jgi:hypothetical protein
MESVGGVAGITLILRNPTILVMPCGKGATLWVTEVVDKWSHDVTRITAVYRLGLFSHPGNGTGQSDSRKNEKTEKQHPMIRPRRQSIRAEQREEAEAEKSNKRCNETEASHASSLLFLLHK